MIDKNFHCLRRRILRPYKFHFHYLNGSLCNFDGCASGCGDVAAADDDDGDGDAGEGDGP